MGVAPNAEDGDETVTIDGLKLFLEREANKMLSNATIDFSELQGFSLEGVEQSPCQSNACPTSSGCH
jgi:Fe-S cluster assembly iron-binding protein IscA